MENKIQSRLQQKRSGDLWFFDPDVTDAEFKRNFKKLFSNKNKNRRNDYQQTDVR